MVMLVRIADRVFLFEAAGYWAHRKDGRIVFVKATTYHRGHDECLSRLGEW